MAVARLPFLEGIEWPVDGTGGSTQGKNIGEGWEPTRRQRPELAVAQSAGG